MKASHALAIIVASASVLAMAVKLAAKEDRYALKSPNSISFSEFEGYERWQMVTPSQSDHGTGCGTSPDPGCIKVTLGNPVLIKAYADGIPRNGQSVPDGAASAKIEWSKAINTEAGYDMTVAGELAEVSFMMKDSRRFPDTDGWGYAKFKYDSASDKWFAFGDGPEFAEACHACHTIVKGRDFLFTHYSKR